jgi:hypothetical protein
MAIAAGDILRIALQWFAAGIAEQVNVHHFEVDSVGTTSGDLDFMTQLVAMLGSELYDVVTTAMADDILGGIVTGQNITKTETLPPVVNTLDGTASGDEGYARQVTGLVYMNSGFPRRQGRSYLPSFTEGFVGDDGSWSSGGLAVLADYASKITLTITDGDISIHRVITHPDGSVPVEITFAGFDAFPRTQRRRTPGFGS